MQPQDPFAQPQPAAPAPQPTAPQPTAPATQPTPPPTHQSADYPAPAQHYAPAGHDPVPHQPAAHISNVKAVEHVSNPYIATANGLVTILKTNPGPAMLAVVAGTLITLPIGLIVLLAGISRNSAGNIISILLTIVWYIVLIPLVFGSSIVVASASAKEEKITTKQALSTALSKALPLFGLMILGGLFVGLASLLLIIPGLIVMARISLASIVMFEENLGVIDSIKRSFSLTKGHFFEIWGAIFSSIFMSGYGSLLSPAIGAAPMLARYQQYASIEAGKTSATKTHWLNYFNIIITPIIFVILHYLVLILVFGLTMFASPSDEVDTKYTPRTPYSSPSFKYDSSPSTDYDYDF